jgi:hypothetical protein
MKAKATLTLKVWYDNVDTSFLVVGVLQNMVNYAAELGLMSEPGGPTAEDFTFDVKVEPYED